MSEQLKTKSEKLKLRTIKPTDMKRTSLLIIFLFSFLAGIYAQDMRLDEILDHYFKANGFDKLQKVQTIVMKGSLTQQDIMPVKQIKMRPDKYFMEFDVADITAYQAYDGKTAWRTAPWTGNPKPQLMNEEAAKDASYRAVFDGLLYNWKSQGHEAELTGKDSVGAIQVYKIKLTRNDKGIEYYYIDTKNYMIQKRIYYRMIRGKETEVANFFRDYRDIEGIKFPFTIDATMDGQPYSSIQYDTIELNVPVDQKIFEMPVN
jgi:hypothetical protein